MWYLAIACIAILLVWVSAIAFFRWLFSSIYAKGNLYDSLLLEWMQRVDIPNWQALQQKSGISSTAIWQLRDGDTTNLKLYELSQIATVLCVPLAELLEKLGFPLEHPELAASRLECAQLTSQWQQVTKEQEALRQEGLRLHQELQQQRLELTQELRQSTFEQLQTLLTNYPSIHSLVGIKPELPAKNLLSLFTSLNYEQIGKPWQKVPFEPQIHQPDASDITVGELVYIRFVGYKHQQRILCPAKVSRNLPGGVGDKGDKGD
ncbi:hypothetical protein UH38_00020 [Aliterella atlantica CENA595]|uniref:Uncharacterized protein n=1 Tax=Aliterella atlantica CENA595 TaxID=1618023 RepID=A0A0D8ZYW4_9CYAN|nr:hypothetical protein UH38_00020 [Aliterella atlantica CENA595]